MVHHKVTAVDLQELQIGPFSVCSSDIVSINSCDTEVCYADFVDSNGRVHYHDENDLVLEMICNNGHNTFESVDPPKCPAPDCTFGTERHGKIQKVISRK